MKLENNWKQKTLENLEKKIWPPLSSYDGSYLIKTCNSLRKKQLVDFTTEDLRIMIGQEIGLFFLVPLAIETLTKDLFAEGDFYKGDLLKYILEIDKGFWNENPNYWRDVHDLIKDRRPELAKMKFDISKFYSIKNS